MSARQPLSSLRFSPVSELWKPLATEESRERSWSKGGLPSSCTDVYDWSSELAKIRQKTRMQRLSIRTHDHLSLQCHIEKQHLCDLQRAFQHIEKQRMRSHIRSFSNRSVVLTAHSARRRAGKRTNFGGCPFVGLSDLKSVRGDWMGKEGKRICVSPTAQRTSPTRRKARKERNSTPSLSDKS